MLGKLPPTARSFAAASAALDRLAPPPATIDYYGKVHAWPPMLNVPSSGDMNDCTIAAAGHMIQQWTTYSQPAAIIPSDPDIRSTYEVFVGANTKGFVKLTDVLDYWKDPGISVGAPDTYHPIISYALLDEKNRAQVKASVYLFGNCYLGLALPDHVTSSTAWDDAAAAYAPNDSNGHCVPVVGYDDKNAYVVTWGALIPMSWKFFETFMDEAYAVLAPDWIAPAAVPPFDLTSLMGSLRQISPPTRAEVKSRVLSLLNSILAATRIRLPSGASAIPNTTSAEALTLWPDCGLSSYTIAALAPDLSKICTDAQYTNGKAITDTSALKTVGDTITLTWARAKGYSKPPAAAGCI